MELHVTGNVAGCWWKQSEISPIMEYIYKVLISFAKRCKV